MRNGIGCRLADFVTGRRYPVVKPGYLWNFYHINAHPVDVEMIFGGFTQADQVFQFDNSDTMAHLAVKAGWFPSLTRAKNAGWSGAIPDGWSSNRKIGGQWPVYIYNPQVARDWIPGIKRPNNVSHAVGAKVEPIKQPSYIVHHKPLTENERLLKEFAHTKMVYPSADIE